MEIIDTSGAKQFTPYATHYYGEPIYAKDGYHVLSDALLSFTDDQLDEIEKDWQATTEINRMFAKYNVELYRTLKDDVVQFCNDLGLPTYKRSGGRITHTYIELKRMLDALSRKVPTTCPYRVPEIRYVMVGTEKVLLIHSGTLKEKVAKARQLKDRAKKVEDAQRQVVIKAAALAEKYGVPLDDPDLVSKVRAADQEAWVKENYPDGVMMNANGCSECDTWIVGEHRCSCGNRRMLLTVEGDIGKWYAYSEAY